MNKSPIVIVEDNIEDCQFLTEALGVIGIKNPLRCFDNGTTALEYLRKTTEYPFLIISDIKMPIMNGLEFRRGMLSEKTIAEKKIPFVFLSALPPSFYEKEVKGLSVQGHFKKPANFEDMIHTTRSLIEGLNRVERMTQ